MNNFHYRFVCLAWYQDCASAIRCVICRSRYAVLLAAVSVIASPAFAQEKSRDLATFFSGHLTATGQFKNYHDGSTRGVRVDIYGARDGAHSNSSRARPIPMARSTTGYGDSPRSSKGGTSAGATA